MNPRKRRLISNERYLLFSLLNLTLKLLIKKDKPNLYDNNCKKIRLQHKKNKRGYSHGPCTFLTDREKRPARDCYPPPSTHRHALYALRTVSSGATPHTVCPVVDSRAPKLPSVSRSLLSMDEMLWPNQGSHPVRCCPKFGPSSASPCELGPSYVT